MDAGIAAIGGALAGALATLGAAFVTGWVQREGARISVQAEYRNELRQPRREAYREFISAATQLSSATASEVLALDENLLNGALRLGGPIDKAWLDISLLGPKRALANATQVRRHAFAAIDLLYTWKIWLSNGAGGPEDDRRGEVLSQQLDNLAVLLSKSVEDFAESAQQALEETGMERRRTS